MATNSLNIIPSFRPLRQSGVMNILFDNPEIDFLEEKKSLALKKNSNAQSTTISSNEQNKQKCIGIVSKKVEKRDILKQDKASVDIKDKGLEFLPFEKWPNVWQECFAQTHKCPKILWTYEGLGQDLSGEPNSNHRCILQRLLQDINLPKGSHTFWPLQVFPNNCTEEENIKIFVSGVQLIAPEWIVFMTGSVPKGLDIAKLCLFVPEVIWGKFVLLAPHIDNIFQNNSRYNQLIGFLKSRFSN